MRLTDAEINVIARRIVARRPRRGRIPLVAANWKMNKTPTETTELLHDLRSRLRGVNCDVIVAPPHVCLDRAAAALTGSPLLLGAQNVHWEIDGAFTGEISVSMLRDLGVQYVIIAHSERRHFFGETDTSANRRVKAVLQSGMTPVVCVGEGLLEREENRTLDVIRGQLTGCLQGLAKSEVERLVIAYEPVWAIGTGKVASTDEAQQVHAAIRGYLGEMSDGHIARSVRIIYGGSVNAENAPSLLAAPDIDGALVGGASLDGAQFAAICRSAA